MPRTLLMVLAMLLTLLATTSAEGQQWRPPTRQMPTMPTMSELSGNWMGPRAEWFSGVDRLSGIAPSQLRAVGQGRSGSAVAQVVHFNNGPVPVVVWHDRNSDGRADLIEIYRGGGVIVQVIDADYDGQANVMRIYDTTGALSREERL